VVSGHLTLGQPIGIGSNLMPVTHSQISESKVDSENRPQKSVPIVEVDFSYRIHSGWKIGAENKHGRMQRKNYEFPV